jgi:outer membrane protein TolC
MFIVCWARLRPWTARLLSCLFAFLASGIAGAVDPLSLEEALAIAGRSSQQLAAQRSSVSAAGQAAVPARELPDPKLFFGIDNLPVTGPDSFSLTRDFMTMRKIGLMQDFPRAQKRELKGHLAEQMAAREATMLVDSQAALRREVALAWMQRYFAERLSSLVTEQIAETELQREALRAGVKSSRTQPADLLAVEVALQSLLDRRAQYDKEAARAKASLSRWLADAAERPLAELVLPASPPEAGELSSHIERHPHVQSLQREIEIAQTQAQIAQAATKPDWSLELAYAQRGPSFSNMVSVQVSVDLPIFQSRRKQPDIAARLMQVEQARSLREEALRQHVAEAQAVQAERQGAHARAARFDETLLPLARERVKTALAAYRGGRGDLASVLDARRVELDLKLQRQQIAAEEGLAYAQLLYFTHREDPQ